MKNNNNVSQMAQRILSELHGCFEDTENGTAIQLTTDEEAKDFLQGFNLAATLLLNKLTGNDGDVFDTMFNLIRVSHEYHSGHE